MKNKMNGTFNDLSGGLFSAVTKSDLNYGAQALMEDGVEIMAWADAFFPDPSIPESVKHAMHEAIESGAAAHYSASTGLQALREVLANKVSNQTGLPINPNRNLIVTAGSDAALLYAMMPFINEKDEVMVLDPSYPRNFFYPKLLGGTAVTIPLYEEDNYQLRIEEFEKRLTDKTKLVLITHPNNPTTTVFKRESIEALCEFIIKHDLILICDQAFEDHIYDDIEFVHPCTMPGMWERTLTICSISKGIGLTGFRIGYIYTNDVMMDVLYGGASHVLSAATTITSLGAIAAVKDEQHLQKTYNRLERRRQIAYDILSSIPGVFMKKSESGIVAWLNISKLGTSSEIVDYLLSEAKILVNSGAAYGKQGEGYIRIVTACFNDDEKAAQSLTRIKAALTKLAKEKGLDVK